MSVRLIEESAKRCPRKPGERHGRKTERGLKQNHPHKAYHYFSSPPLLLETWLNASLQEHNSIKALLFIYLNNEWDEAENEKDPVQVRKLCLYTDSD